MTKVEEVAKAIHEARYDEPFFVDKPIPWVMNAARAAVAALREPTPEMIEAGMETGQFENDVFTVSDSAAKFVFQAMIDAALK